MPHAIAPNLDRASLEAMVQGIFDGMATSVVELDVIAVNGLYNSRLF